MCVPRPLVFWLLIALSVATAAAQSLPYKSPDSSQPVAALSQNAESGTGFFQFQPPFLADGQSLSNATPDSIESEHDSSDALPPVRAPHILTLQQNEATCYTLRTYRVTRDDPESDSTRPAGYSTCQRSTRFQLRTAVDSREIAPR